MLLDCLGFEINEGYTNEIYIFTGNNTQDSGCILFVLFSDKQLYNFKYCMYGILLVLSRSNLEQKSTASNLLIFGDVPAIIRSDENLFSHHHNFNRIGKFIHGRMNELVQSRR